MVFSAAVIQEDAQVAHQNLTPIPPSKLAKIGSPLYLPRFPAADFRFGVQLFLFLNDLAGRFPWLDEGARFFYVGAVPLVAALFLGQLLLFSPSPNASKIRLAAAVVLALLFLAVIGISIEFFAHSWHLGTLSPRPFMTRRIHWLVVEPQDNSFPCYEVAVAAILATAMAFSDRRWGIAGAFLTVLLGLTRLFCGNNFLADVAIGALLGIGLCAACAALCTAPQPFERVALRGWVAGSALVAASLCASYLAFAQTPRFAAKMPLFWSSTATAASTEARTAADNAPDGARKATRAARASIGEGEGIAETAAVNDPMGHQETGEPSAELLALSKRSHLFLPDVEKFLRGKLAPSARPFALLDVGVAPVKTGHSTYRCAAIRFEINEKVPDLRRRTADTAAKLTKLAFASDSQLQNVDITAILRGDGLQIDGSQVRFAGDEVPVFTASIARQHLHVASPRWANDPKLKGGLWLRTRSRLFINEKILPALLKTPVPIPEPTSAPKPEPKAPKILDQPLIKPTVQPFPTPSTQLPAKKAATPVAKPAKPLTHLTR